MSTSHGQFGNPVDFSTQIVVHREIDDFRNRTHSFPKLALATDGKAEEAVLSDKDLFVATIAVVDGSGFRLNASEQTVQPTVTAATS